MHLKFILFSICLLLMAACGSGASKGAAGNANPAAPNGPYFQFAQGPKVLQYEAAGSWCDAHFPESPPLTGDPTNANLRRVGLSVGIYKATVSYGNIASSFMIRVNANQLVELYTSDHFPFCLSNQQNFKLSADGRSFDYNNNHHIRYTLELEQGQNGISMAFLYTAADNFGFSVHKCVDCK